MRSDLVDIEMKLIHETEAAILVTPSGDDKDKVWLPKSKVEFVKNDRKTTYTVTMPEGLAEEKGLESWL